MPLKIVFEEAIVRVIGKVLGMAVGLANTMVIQNTHRVLFSINQTSYPY